MAVKLDIAKYKAKLHAYVMDLWDSAQQRRDDNLAKFKHIDMRKLQKSLEELGYKKEAPELFRAIKVLDSKKFSVIYSKILQDVLKRTRKDIDLYSVWRPIYKDLDAVSEGIGAESGYTKDQALKDSKDALKETVRAQGNILKDLNAAIKRIEFWNGSDVVVRPQAPHDEFGETYLKPATTAYVEVGKNKAGFTYFGPKDLDDVLDAGDTDFFMQSGEEQDYFNLVREIRQPGSTSKPGKLLRLYTARPLKDRKQLESWASKKSMPNNIFMTDSITEAEGYAAEYPPRDIWKIQIREKYVTQTQERGGMAAGNYQTMGPGGWAPVEKMENMQPALETTGSTMPTLKEFGEAAKKLAKVSGYKPMGDGINVIVEGEPIYIEHKPGKGYFRHDFTISVPLGKTVNDAVKGFDKMLKTPFETLKKKYGQSTADVIAELGIDTTVSDKLAAAGYHDLAQEVLAAGAEIPDEIKESFNAMTQLANALESKAKMLRDRQWHFLTFYTKQGKKAATSIVPVMKVFATDIADLAKEAAGLTKTVKEEFSQEPQTILRRRPAAADVEE